MEQNKARPEIPLAEALNTERARQELRELLEFGYHYGFVMLNIPFEMAFVRGLSVLGMTRPRLKGKTARIVVSAYPILKPVPHGLDICKAIVLHELGHHFFHFFAPEFKEIRKVFKRTFRHKRQLYTLLNILLDEHLERHLRGKKPEWDALFQRANCFAEQLPLEVFLRKLAVSDEKLAQSMLGNALEKREIRVFQRGPEKVVHLSRGSALSQENHFTRLEQFLIMLRRRMPTAEAPDQRVREALGLVTTKLRHMDLWEIFNLAKDIGELLFDKDGLPLYDGIDMEVPAGDDSDAPSPEPDFDPQDPSPESADPPTEPPLNPPCCVEGHQPRIRGTRKARLRARHKRVRDRLGGNLLGDLGQSHRKKRIRRSIGPQRAGEDTRQASRWKQEEERRRWLEMERRRRSLEKHRRLTQPAHKPREDYYRPDPKPPQPPEPKIPDLMEEMDRFRNDASIPEAVFKDTAQAVLDEFMKNRITRFERRDDDPRHIHDAFVDTINLAPELSFPPLKEVVGLKRDKEKSRALEKGISREAKSLAPYFTRLEEVMREENMMIRGRRLDLGGVKKFVLSGAPNLLINQMPETGSDFSKVFLGILVDSSASMGKGDRMKTALSFATLIAKCLEDIAGIEARFYAFNQSLFLCGGPADCAISSAIPAGETNEAAALEHVFNEAVRSGRSRKHVVVISDSHPTRCSLASVQHLLRVFERKFRVRTLQVAVAKIEHTAHRNCVNLSAYGLSEAVTRFGKALLRMLNSG